MEAKTSEAERRSARFARWPPLSFGKEASMRSMARSIGTGRPPARGI